MHPVSRCVAWPWPPSPGERQVIVMGQSVSQMVAEAKARIQNLSPDQVAGELSAGKATLIDIRDESELASTGRIPQAHHAPRGRLEFYADPTSPYYREEFDPEVMLSVPLVTYNLELW